MLTLASALADLEEALNAEETTPAERRGLLTYVVASVTPREMNGEMGVLITLKSPISGPGGEKLAQIVSMISIHATIQSVWVEVAAPPYRSV